MRAAARGLALVVVNPTFVLGPDDPSGTSNALVTRFLQRQIPFYVDGGLNIVDVRDVADGPPARRREGQGRGSATSSAGRNFTLGRLFADLGRISGVPPPPLKVPPQLTTGGDRARRPGRVADPGRRGRGALRAALVDLPQHQGEERARLQAAPPRGDARGRGRWQAERLGDRVGRAPRTDIALRAFGRVLQLGERVGLG